MSCVMTVIFTLGELELLYVNWESDSSSSTPKDVL